MRGASQRAAARRAGLPTPGPALLSGLLALALPLGARWLLPEQPVGDLADVPVPVGPRPPLPILGGEALAAAATPRSFVLLQGGEVILRARRSEGLPVDAPVRLGWALAPEGLSATRTGELPLPAGSATASARLGWLAAGRYTLHLVASGSRRTAGARLRVGLSRRRLPRPALEALLVGLLALPALLALLRAAVLGGEREARRR